jgi:hypothetical protein
MSNIVGRVVYYEEDPSNPATGFNAGAYAPIGSNYFEVVVAMAMNRPSATICIKPVNTIPSWVCDY